MATKRLADLLPDYVTKPEDLEGQYELRGTQTEYDARATARLPGDNVEDHVFYTPPNPYLYKPYSELKALLYSGTLSIEEERQVRKAMAHQQRA